MHTNSNPIKKHENNVALKTNSTGRRRGVQRNGQKQHYERVKKHGLTLSFTQ
jgi:hypothetical protein